MANETVTLLRYAKIPGLGWRRGQAIIGKNGKVSPDHMLLGKRNNKRKAHAPEGHFELRYFDGRLPRYPRAELPHTLLSGMILAIFGQYERAVEEAAEAVRLNPDFPISRRLLMASYIGVNRLDQAKAVYEQALQRKLRHPFFMLTYTP